MCAYACVCICVCMYVCIVHVYMYVYVYIQCMSVCIHAYTFKYAHVWVYICTRVGAFCLISLLHARVSQVFLTTCMRVKIDSLGVNLQNELTRQLKFDKDKQHRFLLLETASHCKKHLSRHAIPRGHSTNHSPLLPEC